MIRFSSIVGALPTTTPFVAPETLERQRDAPLRVRLGANESGFGMSPKATEAMMSAVHDSWMYGDPTSFDLRKALAAKHQVSMDQICVGSGIDDFLGLIARTFVDPGSKVVASEGSYPTFHFHVLGFGGRPCLVRYHEFRNDLPGLVESAAAHNPVLVYVSNPDNPTGSWHSPRSIQEFAKSLPSSSMLVLDEAYGDLAPEETAFDPENQNIIVLRTFSKAFGMAGARIGYAIANRSIIEAFDKIRHHFGVNRIAQAGALASLNDSGFLSQVLSEVKSGRDEYALLAAELGLQALESHTNFVAVDVGSAERSKAIVAGLLDRGVFIRRPGIGELARLIRLTVGPKEERKLLSESLREVIATLK